MIVSDYGGSPTIGASSARPHIHAHGSEIAHGSDFHDHIFDCRSAGSRHWFPAETWSSEMRQFLATEEIVAVEIWLRAAAEIRKAAVG